MIRTFSWPELLGPLHERQPWGGPGVEPSLAELIEDPVVQALMRRDGVSRAVLEIMIAHARQRLRQCKGSGASLGHDDQKRACETSSTGDRAVHADARMMRATGRP
jgi:hypothetical protein